MAIAAGVAFRQSSARISTSIKMPRETRENQYTRAQVAMHTDTASCWVAINGGVYDLTTWIAQHPGGEAAILSLCGTDGSAAFSAQHGGQSRPEAQLATFHIGTLVN